MATAAVSGASAERTEAVILRRVPLAALVAAVVGTIGNVVLFLIGQATGAIEAVTLPNGQVFGVAAVISITVMTAVAAAVVYAIIGAIGRIRRPITVFRIVALAVLLLSFLSPFSVPGLGLGFILFLEAMHVVAAAADVWALTTLAGRK